MILEFSFAINLPVFLNKFNLNLPDQKKKKKMLEKKRKVPFLPLGLVMPGATAAILQARGKKTEGQRPTLKT